MTKKEAGVDEGEITKDQLSNDTLFLEIVRPFTP